MLMEETGIEDHKTLERYQQIKHINNRVERFQKVKEKQANGSKNTTQNDDKLGLIKQLLGDLTKEEKVKLLSDIL